MKKKMIFGLFFVLGAISMGGKAWASDYDIVTYDLQRGTEAAIDYDAVYFNGAPQETASFNPEARLRTIWGEDDRLLVENTARFPYAPIVQLTMKKTVNGAVRSYTGSGVMINKNTILTAAHCVYNTGTSSWYDEIVVTPGANGNQTPYGSAKAVQVEIIQKWKTATDTGRKDSANDIAAIRLNKNIGTDTGWFGVTSAPDTTQPFTITGYPGEKDGRMYTQTETLESNFSIKDENTGVEMMYPTWTRDEINYKAFDVTGGNSGSPMYTSEHKVAGVVSMSKTFFNTSTRLLNEKYAIAYFWATEEMTIPDDTIESITLNHTDYIMEKSEKLQLTAAVMPEEAKETALVWQSSDPSVASVNEQGLVQPLESGKTTITVSSLDGKISAQCEVLVDDHGSTFETATDIGHSLVLTGEDNRRNSTSTEYDVFKITAAYDGAYKLPLGVSVYDENHTLIKIVPGAFVTGPVHVLQANKTYYFKVSSGMMSRYYVEGNKYEIQALDPFDATKEYGIETLKLNHNSPSIPGFISGFGTNFTERNPYAFYKSYRIPSTVTLKALRVNLSYTHETFIEVYNEEKELIGRSSIGEDGNQTVLVDVEKDQVIYTKVVNETPDVPNKSFQLNFFGSIFE